MPRYNNGFRAIIFSFTQLNTNAIISYYVLFFKGFLQLLKIKLTINFLTFSSYHRIIN